MEFANVEQPILLAIIPLLWRALCWVALTPQYVLRTGLPIVVVGFGTYRYTFSPLMKNSSKPDI